MAANSAMSRPRPRLYLITPPHFDPSAFADELDAALAAGDVACLQVRLKHEDATPYDDKAIEAAVAALQPVAHRHDVALLLNDRPDLAKALDCDGAHIGQQDMAYDAARNLLGPDKIIGVTCHASKHLAMLAGEAGADYVAFGAFYPTTTKQAPSAAEAEILTWWQQVMEPPCVAIGGITPANAAPLIAAGADFIAASSGVWAHADGPAAGVAEFNAVFDAAHKNFG